MNILARLLGRTEKRSASPSTWDFLKSQADIGLDTGMAPSAHLAEGLATVTACRFAISSPISMLKLSVYKKMPDGGRVERPDHPIARLFAGDVNEYQVSPEFWDTMLGHCLLRGNAVAGIDRDDAGAVRALVPYHPDWVSVVRVSTTGRYRYDVSLPEGGTRRLLPEEVFHLKDASDDGILGRSRISRARAVISGALQTDSYARSTFANGANMSGVLSHPEALGEDAAERLRRSFEQTYSGSNKAGKVAVLEEGLRWQQISVSPDDAQAIQSRQFGVQELARIFGVPGPIIGDYSGGNYSSVVELGRQFVQYTLMPWVTKLERLIERSLLTPAGRLAYEVEFDVDDLLRGDMLTRFQAYRIAREIGVYNANELRKFEKANPRTDAGGDEFLSPSNMQPEQTGRPVADRGGGDAAAA